MNWSLGRFDYQDTQCIGLERMKSIFKGMGHRGRFLYDVVDLSLTASAHIKSEYDALATIAML